MTRLPCAIAVAKVTEYLLNPDHQDGHSKCAFLIAFGFALSHPEVLAEALLDHGRLPPVRVTETEWGPRYVIEAPLRTPDGRDPSVRTVWQPSSKEDPIAQFVTLVPIRRRKLV